jgi:hypothetical protein
MVRRKPMIAITHILIAWWLSVATYYSAEAHEGLPLWCDRPETPAVYSPDTPPWLAVDAGQYYSGKVRCGDRIRVTFFDGRVLVLQALDAGRLGRYCVRSRSPQGRTHCLPIAADIPEYYWPYGLSVTSAVIVDIRNLDR